MFVRVIFWTHFTCVVWSFWNMVLCWAEVGYHINHGEKGDKYKAWDRIITGMCIFAVFNVIQLYLFYRGIFNNKYKGYRGIMEDKTLLLRYRLFVSAYLILCLIAIFIPNLGFNGLWSFWGICGIAWWLSKYNIYNKKNSGQYYVGFYYQQ